MQVTATSELTFEAPQAVATALLGASGPDPNAFAEFLHAAVGAIKQSAADPAPRQDGRIPVTPADAQSQSSPIPAGPPHPAPDDLPSDMTAKGAEVWVSARPKDEGTPSDRTTSEDGGQAGGDAASQTQDTECSQGARFVAQVALALPTVEPLPAAVRPMSPRPAETTRRHSAEPPSALAWDATAGSANGASSIPTPISEAEGQRPPVIPGYVELPAPSLPGTLRPASTPSVAELPHAAPLVAPSEPSLLPGGPPPPDSRPTAPSSDPALDTGVTGQTAPPGLFVERSANQRGGPAWIARPERPVAETPREPAHAPTQDPPSANPVPAPAAGNGPSAPPGSHQPTVRTGQAPVPGALGRTGASEVPRAEVLSPAVTGDPAEPEAAADPPAPERRTNELVALGDRPTVDPPAPDSQTGRKRWEVPQARSATGWGVPSEAKLTIATAHRSADPRTPTTPLPLQEAGEGWAREVTSIAGVRRDAAVLDSSDDAPALKAVATASGLQIRGGQMAPGEPLDAPGSPAVPDTVIPSAGAAERTFAVPLPTAGAGTVPGAPMALGRDFPGSPLQRPIADAADVPGATVGVHEPPKSAEPAASQRAGLRQAPSATASFGPVPMGEPQGQEWRQSQVYPSLRAARRAATEASPTQASPDLLGSVVLGDAAPPAMAASGQAMAGDVRGVPAIAVRFTSILQRGGLGARSQGTTGATPAVSDPMQTPANAIGPVYQQGGSAGTPPLPEAPTLPLVIASAASVSGRQKQAVRSGPSFDVPSGLVLDSTPARPVPVGSTSVPGPDAFATAEHATAAAVPAIYGSMHTPPDPDETVPWEGATSAPRWPGEPSGVPFTRRSEAQSAAQMPRPGVSGAAPVLPSGGAPNPTPTPSGMTAVATSTSPSTVRASAAAAEPARPVRLRAETQRKSPRLQASRVASGGDTQTLQQGTMTPEPAPTPRSLSVEAVRRVIEIISRPEARQQARLELRVDWDDLGVERVAVHWQGDQARVDVSCRTEATAEALRSTEGLLRQRLANMGVELSELRTSCEAGGGQRSAYDRSDSWRPPQRWQAYGVALPYVTRSTGTTNSARGRTHGVDVWV